MNLDKLKELEAKATQGEWVKKHVYSNYQSGIGNEESDRDFVVVNNQEDTNLICAFRNQAKEMISTIERYKAALELIGRHEPHAEEDYECFYRYSEKVAKEALKDPEKPPVTPETRTNS